MILQSGAIGQIILVFGSPGLVPLSPGYLRSCGQGLSHGHWWAGGGGGCSWKSLPRPPHVMRQSGLFFFFSIGSFLFFGDWTTAGRGQWAFLGSAWLLLISKEWHAGGEVPGPRAAGPGRRAAGRKAAQGTRPQPLSPVGPHSTA